MLEIPPVSATDYGGGDRGPAYPAVHRQPSHPTRETSDLYVGRSSDSSNRVNIIYIHVGHCNMSTSPNKMRQLESPPDTLLRGRDTRPGVRNIWADGRLSN